MDIESKWSWGTVLGLLVVFLAGCGPFHEDWSMGQTNQCSEFGANLDVQGRWTLSGSGQWSNCENGVADGESFDLSSSTLVVAQHEQSTSQSDILSLDPEPADVDFVGTVRGSCVDFRTSEQTDDGEITFEFIGNRPRSDGFRGEFTGTGPGTCESTGEFKVRID